MSRPPLYIDSPISRFLGACLLIVVIALAVTWFLGFFAL